MIEEFEKLEDEILLSVVVESGYDVTEGSHAGEHCAYRIVIRTNRRILTIDGDHDSSPDCKQDGVELWKIDPI